MTTSHPLPTFGISDSIEKTNLGERHRSTLSSSERDKGFTSALMDARRPKSRQNIAAASGKKVAGQHGAARMTARKDDLQNFKLGPRVRIIAPDAPPPDDKSLMDFARSQGIDENVIKLIMAKSGIESTAPQQPDGAKNGIPADPDGQVVSTISAEPGVASESAATVVADNATADVLSPVESNMVAPANGLTPSSWLTGGTQSEYKAPITTGAELLMYNTQANPAGANAENAKPILLSVKPASKSVEPPGSNETVPFGGTSSKIAESRNGVAQSGRDTRPTLPAPLPPPIASQTPWLEGTMPETLMDGLPAEKGIRLLDRVRFGRGNGAIQMTIAGTSPGNVGAEISISEAGNLTEPGQDAAALKTETTSVLGKQSANELPVKKALYDQSLSAIESSPHVFGAGKNPRDSVMFHASQEIIHPAAAEGWQPDSEPPLAWRSSIDVSVAPGHAPSNDLVHASSTGAVVTQRIDISAGPVSPETIKDAAFRRSEQYQLLSDRVSAAVGQRISAEVAKGAWQLDLQLNPAHLGRIDIRLGRRGGGRIDAEFNASESSTKELLASGLPKLKEVMASAGLELNSLSIRGDSAAPKDNGSSSKQGGSPGSHLPTTSESETAPASNSRTNYIRADGLDVTI